MPVEKKRKYNFTCGVITACASAFSTIIVLLIDLLFGITRDEAIVSASALTTILVFIASSGLHTFLQAIWEGVNGNGARDNGG